MKCAQCDREIKDTDSDYLCMYHRRDRQVPEGVEEVIVRSFDEKTAPPIDVMKIARVDDVIFFEIYDRDASNHQVVDTSVTTFGVKIGALKAALDTLQF